MWYMLVIGATVWYILPYNLHCSMPCGTWRVSTKDKNVSVHYSIGHFDRLVLISIEENRERGRGWWGGCEVQFRLIYFNFSLFLNGAHWLNGVRGFSASYNQTHTLTHTRSCRLYCIKQTNRGRDRERDRGADWQRSTQTGRHIAVLGRKAVYCTVVG